MLARSAVGPATGSSSSVFVDRGKRWRVPDARARYALEIVAVAAAYTASGKLGLDLAFATRNVTAIWPPTGIALVALVLGGYRLWPAVALGALLTNVNTGVPAVTALGLVAGNTLEALAGAFFLRRVAGFGPGLERVRDVLALVAFGGAISTVLSASIGVTSLLVGGAISWAHVPSLWRTWWLGDMGGDLIVAPALLIAVAHRRYRRLPGRSIEAAVLALVLAAVSVLVFSRPTAIMYLLFPLLIWASLRFWQPGAAVASLLVGAVAVAFTANGRGPFAMISPDERLLLAQTFVAIASVTALMLAAVTSERRRAEEAEVAGLRERDRVRDLFGRHVGEEVARSALGRELEMGGELRDAAILFVDVIGSTAFAAMRDPRDVVEALNRFFEIVVEVVSLHGGWINKFGGDAALCVFGAPAEHPDAARAALVAARELRRRLASELDGMEVAIGLSAGDVAAGNIGAAQRYEYTVIGDPVNEAARLTELAKSRPSRMLASEAIVRRAGEREAGRWELGESVVLRGRSGSTRVAAPA
jgi:class 3 adenylate cyclase/integral membrane sensor domain MASE1